MIAQHYSDNDEVVNEKIVFANSLGYFTVKLRKNLLFGQGKLQELETLLLKLDWDLGHKAYFLVYFLLNCLLPFLERFYQVKKGIFEAYIKKLMLSSLLYRKLLLSIIENLSISFSNRLSSKNSKNYFWAYYRNVRYI